MAKELEILDGGKVAALRERGEKHHEFAGRAKISARKMTDLVKPGPHQVNHVTLDRFAELLKTDRAGVLERLGFNPPAGAVELPTALSNEKLIETLGPLLAEAARRGLPVTPHLPTSTPAEADLAVVGQVPGDAAAGSGAAQAGLPADRATKKGENPLPARQPQRHKPAGAAGRRR